MSEARARGGRTLYADRAIARELRAHEGADRAMARELRAHGVEP